MRKQYAVSISCEVLEVSASGYFIWQRRRDTERPGPAGRLSDEAKGEYDWPRMHMELPARGIRVCKDRVRKLRKKHGIKARTKRKFVVTTDSKHSLPVASDLVRRRFNPEAPNRLWSGDIAYVATDEGSLYLAAAIALFSRQVVGWSMQAHMQTSLVKDAVSMARFRPHPGAGLIFHSDSGGQGGLNRPSQHRVVGRILSIHSRLQLVSSNRELLGSVENGQPVRQEVRYPA